MQPTPTSPIPVGERNAAGIQHYPVIHHQGTGYTLTPRPRGQALPESSPLYDDIHAIWNPDRFLIPREPIIVGHVPPASITRGTTERVFALPLKFPNSDYRIPDELDWLADTLQICIDAEHTLNPHVDEYYAYLDLDSSTVEIGGCQRSPGPHSDNIQGQRVQPKQPTEHCYAVVSSHPTCFYVQPFDLREHDPETHYANTVFEAQLQIESGVCHTAGDITFFDAYSVHAAVPIIETGWRTFVRLVYTTRQYDRLGNSHNPLFDYQWNMVRRALPDNLIGLPHAA